MQKLQTVGADTLIYEPLEKPSFVVDGLIPTGLTLFCGSQKIGKSWLMLKLCLCVSQGIPLWDMPTQEGDVLYLCLEDTFCRIQDRLFRLTDEASGRLHFAVASDKLSDGLIVQLEDYLKEYPDSRLIVIDTLQKVRTASKDNAYASDYGDISLIKDFADRHSLAVIVVHHIRKQNDSDVFNKVSGTTGLTGSADATFVLEQESRASNAAKLYVTGRDTPYQEFTLRFRDCSWELVECKEQEQLAKEAIPDVLFRLVDFMQGREEWTGTATELLEEMGETGTPPNIMTKRLNEYRASFLNENNIVTPIITRPKEDGNGYEVIAGQRRVRASELAGINTVPAFVLPLDRDRAIITLVDSNLQRENILPSERAFAYKMKSEAMKRQGFRTDLTSSQVGTKLRTDDKVAQGFGVGRMTVQRFIRLTELIPPILQMVDEGKIALTPAVELSFLKKDEQENLFATMESEEATPSLSQAQRMKALSQSGRLDMDTIFTIMTEEKGNQKETLKINTSKLKKYFPKNTTPKQMEDAIIKLLERELQRKRGRDSR